MAVNVHDLMIVAREVKSDLLASAIARSGRFRHLKCWNLLSCHELPWRDLGGGRQTWSTIKDINLHQGPCAHEHVAKFEAERPIVESETPVPQPVENPGAFPNRV